MSKKNKITTPKNSVANVKPISGSEIVQTKAKTTTKKGIGFFNNFILLVVCIVLVLGLFKGNEGYSWVWNDLINENLKFINKNPHLTDAQKYQSKFGIDAAAIDFIKKQTPDSAIILLPPGAVIMDDSSDYKFLKGLGGIKARNWTIYFLYPRKLVYFDEFDRNKFAKNITHVVCMNGWGYDKLSYNATPQSSFEILPISPTSTPAQRKGDY